MKKRTQIIAMLLATTMLAGCFTGCGNKNENVSKDAATTETAETTEEQNEDKGGTSSTEGYSLAANLKASNLSEELKQKYSDSESSKYEYAEPVYNVERDHKFVFENVGTRYNDDPNYFHELEVYIDSNFISPISVNMEYDSEAETLTLSPGRASLAFEDGIESESGSDWGNAPKYWIVQHNDFATGEKLAKPLVTLFTVEASLNAPKVSFDVNEKGYAQLSWKPVDGATNYKIYSMTESAEYGISLESLRLVGETENTTFTEFPKSSNTFDTEILDFLGDEYASMVFMQNQDFYSFGLSDDDSGLSEVYCVVASNGSNASNISNMIYEKDVRERLVYTRAFSYNEDGSGEEEYETSRETVSELPAFQLVQMADGSIVPMAIDYENATWNEEDYVAEEGNIYIRVLANIVGTELGVTLYATNTPEASLESDLAALAERQHEVSGKSTNIEPQNDIDYVPSTDGTSEEPAEKPVEEPEDTPATEEPVEEPVEDEPDVDEPDVEEPAEKPEANPTNDNGDIKITATSALSEYIATFLLCHEEAIDLSAFPEAGDSDYLVNALMEAYNQNPLIGSLVRYGYDYDTSTLYIEYDYSKEEQADMQEAVLVEANKVVAEIITDDMSDVQKEFAINDYLCSSAEYDYDALEDAEANNFETVSDDYKHSFTPYGVLVNKVGVCASYAGAFKILADMAGLDCYVVTGYLNGNLPHAWNRVEIEDEWITVDSTNNDNEKYANALLNIPDQISSGLLVEDDTYLLSDELAKMQAGVDNHEFYRVQEKYFAMEALKAELETRLNAGENFTIRTDYTITEEEVASILQEALSNSNAERIRYYMFLGVLTVEF